MKISPKTHLLPERPRSTEKHVAGLKTSACSIPSDFRSPNPRKNACHDPFSNGRRGWKRILSAPTYINFETSNSRAIDFGRPEILLCIITMGYQIMDRGGQAFENLDLQICKKSGWRKCGYAIKRGRTSTSRALWRDGSLWEPDVVVWGFRGRHRRKKKTPAFKPRSFGFRVAEVHGNRTHLGRF